MRRVLAPAVLAALLGGAAMHEAAAQSGADGSGLFPQRVAGFALSSVRAMRARAPVRGRFAAYKRTGLYADVSIYTDGRDLPASYDPEVTQASLATANAEIRAAVDNDVYRRAEPAHVFSVRGDDPAQQFDCTRYLVVNQNVERLQSVLCFTTLDHRIIKIRMTGAEDRLPDRIVTSFVRAWLASS